MDQKKADRIRYDIIILFSPATDDVMPIDAATPFQAGVVSCAYAYADACREVREGRERA